MCREPACFFLGFKSPLETWNNMPDWLHGPSLTSLTDNVPNLLQMTEACVTLLLSREEEGNVVMSPSSSSSSVFVRKWRHFLAARRPQQQRARSLARMHGATIEEGESRVARDRGKFQSMGDPPTISSPGRQMRTMTI